MKIRINRQTLSVKEGRDYVEVVFIGDCHYGSPQFDEPRFLSMIDYCVDNNLYVFLMGDIIEMATRDSVGAGVYEQTENGQSQFETMVDWLKPLADRNLLLGLLQGN